MSVELVCFVLLFVVRTADMATEFGCLLRSRCDGTNVGDAGTNVVIDESAEVQKERAADDENQSK